MPPSVAGKSTPVAGARIRTSGQRADEASPEEQSSGEAAVVSARIRTPDAPSGTLATTPSGVRACGQRAEEEEEEEEEETKEGGRQQASLQS